MKKYVPLLLLILSFFLVLVHKFFAYVFLILAGYCFYVYIVKNVLIWKKKHDNIQAKKRLAKMEERSIKRREKLRQRNLKAMGKFYATEEGQKYLEELDQYEDDE